MRKRSKTLSRKLKNAHNVKMTPEQQERQRRAFVYGNARLEDDGVTREDVNRVADMLDKIRR